jgi:hypothetical protein
VAGEVTDVADTPAPPPAVREPEPEYGPAMRALPNGRWRKAAHALFITKGNRAEALRIAGYNGQANGLYASATRMFNDDRMRAAIRELAIREIELSEPECIGTTLEIMRNNTESARDRLAAARLLWDRARPVESRLKVDVSHVLTNDEKEIQHYRALQKIQAPQQAFIDRFGINGLARVEAMIAAEDAKLKQIEGDGVTIEGDYHRK